MDGQRWDRIQELFHGAADLPACDRDGWLARACNGDAVLMASVSAMLEEDRNDASVLDRDLPAIAQTLLVESNASFSGTEFGPYKIKGLLGEGGMGVVYLAEREDIGLLVAVKFLRDAALSPARRAGFVRESKTLARLEHPFIARIFDAGALADGTPWFVMEYVDGVPVTEYCRALKSIDERLRVFRCVCEAVQYAHRQTFIHRDLKPSNMLVRADGTVKLLDFGIAKQLETEDAQPERARTELRPMTLAFASPEQIRGERLDTQSDVYSLGVVLYELLTERLPFAVVGLSATEVEKTIVQQEAEPPSATANGLVRKTVGKAWAELDVLCLTAMHKDRQRRYRSVEALMRDIDHYLKSEPLEARPDSAGYRLGKFVSRNERALLITAVASTAFLAILVFFIVNLARARTAALAEATRTQRIERFMLTLFDGGDKTSGPADSLRVVTLLDRGVQSARTLNAEPAVQAELDQTLGNIYEKLGKFDRADPLLRSSLERRKAIDGAESKEAAEGLVALGLLRLDQGREPEAERFIRDGIAIEKRHLSPDDPAIARATSALGSVLEDRGSYEEAAKILEQAVTRQSAHGEVTADRSESIRKLADAHYYMGHLPTAESLNKQALEMDRQIYGTIHPRVADDLFNLGQIQHDLGHDAVAEQDYRRALAIRKSWYGKEHPDTALSMAAVGQSLIYQGKYDEAAGLLEDALSIQERVLGKIHPQVAMGLNTLGLLEIRRKHWNDAERDFIRMADINRAVYDDRHYLVGIALLNLGLIYVEEKNYARAEQSYREALDRFTEKLPAGHPSIAIAQVRLGHTLVLEHQYREAENLLLAGYTILMKQPGGQAARIADAQTDLAAVYDFLKQPEQAQKFRASANLAKR